MPLDWALSMTPSRLSHLYSPGSISICDHAVPLSHSRSAPNGADGHAPASAPSTCMPTREGCTASAGIAVDVPAALEPVAAGSEPPDEQAVRVIAAVATIEAAVTRRRRFRTIAACFQSSLECRGWQPRSSSVRRRLA